MEKRGIVPTFVRLMQSKRSGTMAIRINVNTKDVKQALENDFWPNHVYVREWLSKEKWSKKNDHTLSVTKNNMGPSEELNT